MAGNRTAEPGLRRQGVSADGEWIADIKRDAVETRAEPQRSPQRAHRVLRNRRIGRHDVQSVGDRLADEHAVERISVQPGKFRKLKRGLFVQCKGRDAVARTHGGNVADRRLGQRN